MLLAGACTGSVPIRGGALTFSIDTIPVGMEVWTDGSAYENQFIYQHLKLYIIFVNRKEV